MIWHIVVGALAMLALSAIFICWPRRASGVNHQTPAQLFEERLQLLVLARDAGELAEQDFSSAAAELKQQFLEQEQKAVRYQQPKHKALFHLSLVLLTALIVGFTYSQNGHYRQLADWEYAKANLPSYGERALFGTGEPMGERDMQLFSLALRTKLAEEGDDAVAWMLLGRVWMTLGMLDEAVESFERAMTFMPERTPLLISYSQALIMLGGELNLAKAARSIAGVLMREPDNIDAISLMALIASERGDNEQAVAAWQLLAERLDPSDPRMVVIQERLQELTGGQVVSETISGRQVQLQLTVAPALAAAHSEAVLLVFVRAANGPPIPLAAKRLPVTAGQQQITLTTADAMQSGWDLNQAELIEVVARIAISGTVERTAQDVEVVSAPLSFSEPAIRLALTLEE